MRALDDAEAVVFRDRSDAGRQLAQRLAGFASEDAVVLGLPRGGVTVAAEVAALLHAPLDVVLVRKLGLPSQPELAMGAIGEDGVRVIDGGLVRAAHVPDAELAAVEARERSELLRRAERYRGTRPLAHLDGRTAIVVDDGIATGATARAACEVVRNHGARRVVLAVPVAARRSVHALRTVADEVVCVSLPAQLRSVGEWYEDFTPTSDDEVVRVLAALGPDPAEQVGPGDLELELDGVRLGGRLVVPTGAIGVVLFAHGSGSSRHSPRNRHVAEVLHRGRIGTVLFDLLTAAEEADRANVFDIGLLGARLAGATRALRSQPQLAGMPIGYFGASTGAAAALWAAAEPDLDIAAVVSRGGRPDLVGDRLERVQAPTLLIVGGADIAVLDLNRSAAVHLQCEHRISVVPRATHLFEEPGALDAVARLATGWFGTHLAAAEAARGERMPHVDRRVGGAGT